MRQTVYYFKKWNRYRMIKRPIAAWCDFYYASLLRRHACKLSGGLRQLGRDSELILEPHVSLGDAVLIKSAKLEIGPIAIFVADANCMRYPRSAAFAR